MREVTLKISYDNFLKIKQILNRAQKIFEVEMNKRKEAKLLNDLSSYLSDFIFNEKISFKELDELYKSAKIKLAKEVTELYKRVK